MNGLGEFLNAAESAAPDALASDFGKPAFHLVQPGNISSDTSKPDPRQSREYTVGIILVTNAPLENPTFIRESRKRHRRGSYLKERSPIELSLLSTQLVAEVAASSQL